MKILHLAYSLSEQSAAFRLAEEQALGLGHEVQFLLARKSSSQFIERKRIYPILSSLLGLAAHLLDHLAAKLLVKKGEIFSIGIGLPFKNWIFEKLILKTEPDVLHVHWGGYGFFPAELLYRLSNQHKIRVVVTTHDYHFFTGGCHIPMNCPQHQNSCTNCPLASGYLGRKWISNQRNISNGLMRDASVTFITPSRYTHDFIRHSFKNLKIQIVPNTAGRAFAGTVDSVNANLALYNKYRGNNKDVATILMVGVKSSSRENKGSDVLKQLAHVMEQQHILFNLITVGEFLKIDLTGSHLHYDNCSVKEMKMLYAVADLCIVPSRFETFSQVTLESIQSATPVVAFDLTGPADIIQEGKSGFLVNSFDIDTYCLTVLNNIHYKFNHQNELRDLALSTAETFSPKRVADLHDKVYCNFPNKPTFS